MKANGLLKVVDRTLFHLKWQNIDVRKMFQKINHVNHDSIVPVENEHEDLLN